MRKTRTTDYYQIFFVDKNDFESFEDFSNYRQAKRYYKFCIKEFIHVELRKYTIPENLIGSESMIILESYTI